MSQLHIRSRGSCPNSRTHSPNGKSASLGCLALTGSGSSAVNEECGKCSKRVSRKSKAIQCDGSCKLWFHFSCVDLSKNLYKSMLQQNQPGAIIWVCNKCTAETTVLRTVTELRVIENQLQELIVEVDRVVGIENTKESENTDFKNLLPRKGVNGSTVISQQGGELGKPMVSLIDTLEKKITELNIGIESLGFSEVPQLGTPENQHHVSTERARNYATGSTLAAQETEDNPIYLNSEVIAQHLAITK